MREDIFTEEPGKVKIIEVTQTSTITCKIVADFIYSVKTVIVDENEIETTQYKAKVDRQVFDGFPILSTSTIEKYLSSVWLNKYAPLQELDNILDAYPSLNGKVLS